jgi:hypothetical protein
MTQTVNGLPLMEENGRQGSWSVTSHDGASVIITGRFLGMGTSHRPEHKNHPDQDYAPQGVHCSTCRWTETRLFRGTDGPYYLVRCGASDVPGEQDRIHVLSVGSPLEVVEAMAVTDRATKKPVLSPVARRALAQAAGNSEALRDAYLNSPVTQA